MKKTFKYRLYPNKQQEEILNSSIEVCRHLYNCCLGERIDAYKDKISFPKSYQRNTLPVLKKLDGLDDDFNINNVHSLVLQDVIVRLDRAYENFFRRVKEGNKKPGFPRFKGIGRYNSITYAQSGWKIEDKHLVLSKIGDIKIKLHRPLEGTPKTCIIIRKANQWYCSISCDDVPLHPFPKTGLTVGVDVGITKFATFSTDIAPIENPRILQKALKELRIAQRELERRSVYEKKKQEKDEKKAKRKLAPCQSHNREKSKLKVSRIHQKVANVRREFHYTEAKKILEQYDVICIEKLNVANMIRNHNLARYIADVGWSQFANILKVKAESAVKYVIDKNPAYSSQRCNKCGHIDKNNRLSQAIFCCVKCGHIDNADKNAAKNQEEEWIHTSTHSSSSKMRAGISQKIDNVIPLHSGSDSLMQEYA